MAPESTVDNVTATPVKKLKKRKCVIESVHRKDVSKAEPVFVNFTNGKPSRDGKLEGQLHQNNTEDFHCQQHRLFSVETPFINYVGKNYGENSLAAKESVYIGVLDKSTGKMRLVEASSYTAHPQVGFLNKKMPEPVHEESYREKQKFMLSQFGSKKAKQVMRQREVYDVDSQGMSHAIHQATSDVKVQKSDLKISTEMENDYLNLLPQFDFEAKKPEDVYKLEWLAPDFFLLHFEETAKSYLAGETEFDEKYTNLMRVMVSVAKFETTEENKVRLVCLSLYVEYLIRFVHLKSFQMKKSFELLQDCPKEVKSHIFKTYTNLKERTFSQVDKDRALCLILVLTLIGCKFEVFTNILVESLHVDLKKLHLLMRAIGATYISENFSFRLKFPLTRIAKSHKKMAKGIR